MWDMAAVELRRIWLLALFYFVTVNAECKEWIENSRFLSEKNVANYATPKEGKIEGRESYELI